MSNTLAIAAVTTTMRHLLHESLGGPEPGGVGDADVSTLHPSLLRGHATRHSRAGLNVYLYDVTWSGPQARNEPPPRGGTRPRGQNPAVALGLHYLVSAFGDDAALEPQRLLARAARALAATPVLARPAIAAAVAEYGSGQTAFLTDSDLAEQPEPVRVMPAPLPIDEASKLWSVLGTPQLLSLAYTAGPVLL